MSYKKKLKLKHNGIVTITAQENMFGKWEVYKNEGFGMGDTMLTKVNDKADIIPAAVAEMGDRLEEVL